jgi:hypothetical protein
MMKTPFRLNRDRTLSTLAEESWRRGCGATADRVLRSGPERLCFEGRAFHATPLPTLPHKGGGVWGACL